jgi:hypothetical protein
VLSDKLLSLDDPDITYVFGLRGVGPAVDDDGKRGELVKSKR